MSLQFFQNFSAISFLFLTIVFPGAISYRILVSVIGISGSQNLVMYRLAEYLGERGHEVVILKAEIFPEAKTIPLKYSRELKYQLLTPEAVDPLRKEMYSMPWQIRKTNPFPVGLLRDLFNGFAEGCENLISKNQVMKELRSESFDVAVVHLVDFCAFGLMKVFKIQGYIWMSTAFMLDPMAWASGVPYPTSYVPSAGHAVYPNMTFLQRGKNLLFGAAIQGVVQLYLYPKVTGVYRKVYGQDFPSMNEILKNTSLYFVNSDPFFDFPRPTQHNVVYIGGFTSSKPSPLTPDWQKIMDDSREGVVVFSMGSVVNTEFMPREYKVLLYSIE